MLRLRNVRVIPQGVFRPRDRSRVDEDSPVVGALLRGSRGGGTRGSRVLFALADLVNRCVL